MTSRLIQTFLFSAFVLQAFSSFSQKTSRKKPSTLQERRKAEQKAYEKRWAGNDSIYIRFLHLQSKDSVSLFTANGWYKSPMVPRKSEALKGYELIIPAQQSLDRVLTISAFDHEITNPLDFKYPKKFRNGQPLPDFSAQSGVLDGVYINDTTQYDFATENVQLLDSVYKTQESFRNQNLQPWITGLLQPFYFGQTEVTNAEYRRFVDWVRDSIARNMIYDSLKDDGQAVSWLNISKKELAALDISKRAENLKKYGLNHRKKVIYDDEIIIPLLNSMYYPQPERFYKRRMINTQKLVYKGSSGKETAVYPDTAAWLEGVNSPFDPMLDMYFWHVAYDRYPVLGLTYEQAQAYCEWYQHQMNETLENEGWYAEVIIPDLFEYEMAAKYDLAALGKDQLKNLPNAAYQLYKRPLDGSEHVFLSDVSAYELRSLEFTPGEAKLSQGAWKYNNWFRANGSYPIHFLNGNVSEFCRTPVTPEMISHYQLDPTENKVNGVLVIGSNFREDVIDLTGNQKNALFYKRIVPKTKSSPVHGFRTVIRLTKI